MRPSLAKPFGPDPRVAGNWGRLVCQELAEGWKTTFLAALAIAAVSGPNHGSVLVWGWRRRPG